VVTLAVAEELIFFVMQLSTVAERLMISALASGERASAAAAKGKRSMVVIETRRGLGIMN
jgi:hypothetical protein